MNDRIKELCTQIQDEQNPSKLTELVAELQALLDEHLRNGTKSIVPTQEKSA